MAGAFGLMRSLRRRLPNRKKMISPPNTHTIQADEVFTAMASRVNGELVRKVKAVFRFNASRGAEKRTWTVDLKNGAGSVKETAEGKADCTLSLSDADLADLVAGKKDAMKLFMGGQLKISGNMMLAQKLQVVFKAESPSATRKHASAEAAEGTSSMLDNASPQAQAVFKDVQKRLGAAGNAVPHVFVFQLEQPTGEADYFTVDGKSGKVYGGLPQGEIKAECTLVLSEARFLELAANPTSALSMFMNGQMRISGNMMLAQRLQTLFQKQASL